MTKRKREQLTSLTLFSGISQHLNLPKRVNAHAERRELSTSVLVGSFDLGDFEKNKNQKWSITICPCYVVMLPYAVQFYWFNSYFVSISSRYFTIFLRI